MRRYELTVQSIRNELEEYITEHKIKSLVLGVSGGADSALCAALANPVCNKLGIKLIGRSIPIQTNKQDEMERANLVGEAFCHDYKEVDLSAKYDNLVGICLDNGVGDPESTKEKIRRGNVKARMRMILLYDLAHRNDGMVLSTDNYTELMVGFFSLHGDVGDYGMIQNLWKTEVYGMMRYLAVCAGLTTMQKKALMDCVNAVPTDGLGITSSDLEQLGAKTYAEVDRILQDYFDIKVILTKQIDNDMNRRMNDRLNELQQHPVIQRHLRTEFKRNNPYNIPRKKMNG